MTARRQSIRISSPFFASRFLTPLISALALVAPMRGEAQSLVVTVRHVGSRAVAPGTLVTLTNPTAGPNVEPAARAIVRESGNARLTAPAGQYRLTIERPGFADSSFAITLTRDDSLTVELGPTRPGFPSAAVALPTACAAPGMPVGLAAPWAEARKTIRVVRAGEAIEAVSLSVTAFDRTLSTGMKIESHQNSTLLGAGNEPPNTTSAQAATQAGYLARRDSLTWSAPDLATFGTAEFEGSHCFGWGPGTGERDGMIGLQFAPRASATVGIEGALWFDPGTRELRTIDYRFSSLPKDWRPEVLGGAFEFRRSDHGFWVTNFWYQRTPRVRLAQGPELKGRLLGFHETGAEVTAVEPAVDTTDRVATAQAIARRAAEARGRLARILGTVKDTLGYGVPDAEIAVLGTELTAASDSAGRFVIGGLPLGVQVVRIRKIGYRAKYFGLRLSANEDWEGTITLSKLPVILAEIMVVGKYGKPEKYAATAKYDDFYRRRAGRVGKYMTREDIDKAAVGRIADLIQRAAGVRNTFNPVGGRDRIDFPGCASEDVAVWIDGQRLSGSVEEVLPLITPLDVEALEVYARQSLIPGEYQDGACAAVVLWTR